MVVQLCKSNSETPCLQPGSSVHATLQARTLEWVAISFSRGSSWPRDRTQVSCIAGRCFTLWATIPPRISLSSHFLHFQAIGTWAVFPLLIPWLLLALCCGASFPRPLEAALKSVPRGIPWWLGGEESAFTLRWQGVPVQSLVQEDPTCRGATKPMGHSKRSHPMTSQAPHLESSPHSLQLEKAWVQLRRPCVTKNK